MAMMKVNGFDLHYHEQGRGTPVLFVHGGVLDGAMTWSEQEPLAGQWTLIVIDRPGFGSSSAVERVDFATDAGVVAEILIRAGDLWGDKVHLVGHSYGGVIALLAAGMRPEAVRSLTVIEPPAFGIAQGHDAVDRLVADLQDLWRNGPRDDPARFLDRFLRHVGSGTRLPVPLPPSLADGAALLTVERGPWEAEIPLGRLADTEFAKLVVSGGHSAAFDAICDVLQRELEAERMVIRGAGHSVPKTGEPFNRTLDQFLAAAERSAGSPERV
jgi:pimeloyl-ACP methyl ester carboxylesterase